MDKMMNFFNLNLFAESINVDVVLGHSIRSQKDPRKLLKLQFNPNDPISAVIDYMIANYDINLPYGVKKDDCAMYGLYLNPSSNPASLSSSIDQTSNASGGGNAAPSSGLASSGGTPSTHAATATVKAPRSATKESDSDADDLASQAKDLAASSSPPNNPSPVISPTSSSAALATSSGTPANATALAEYNRIIFLNDRDWLDTTQTFKHYQFPQGVSLTFERKNRFENNPLEVISIMLPFHATVPHRCRTALTAGELVQELISQEGDADIAVLYEHECDLRLYLPVSYRRAEGKLLGFWLDPTSTLISFWEEAQEKIVILCEGEELPPLTDLQHESLDRLKEDETAEWWLAALEVNDWNLYRNDPELYRALKTKCREGLPSSLRGKIWYSLSGAQQLKQQEQITDQFYSNLVTKQYRPPDSQTPTSGATSSTTSSSHQVADYGSLIRKDAIRTKPDTPFFSTKRGHQQLINVLTAYSHFDKRVGYCQGMNFIVATLLMTMNEENAFWTLYAMMVNYGMRDFYGNDIKLLHTSLEQFDNCVNLILYNIGAQLAEKQISSTLFGANWFHTLFSCVSHTCSFVMRIWDVFFHEGFCIIYRVGLAILKKNEAILNALKLNDVLHNPAELIRLGLTFKKNIFMMKARSSEELNLVVSDVAVEGKEKANIGPGALVKIETAQRRSSFSFSPNSKPLVTITPRQRALVITPGKTKSKSNLNSSNNTPRSRGSENRSLSPITPPNFSDPNAAIFVGGDLDPNTTLALSAEPMPQEFCIPEQLPVVSPKQVENDSIEATQSTMSNPELSTATAANVLSVDPALRRHSSPSPLAASSSRRLRIPLNVENFVFGFENVKLTPPPSPNNDSNTCESTVVPNLCNNSENSSGQESQSNNNVILATTEIAASTANVEGMIETSPPPRDIAHPTATMTTSESDENSNAGLEAAVQSTPEIQDGISAATLARHPTLIHTPLINRTKECDSLSYSSSRIQHSLSNPNFKSPKKFSSHSSPQPCSSSLSSATSASSPMLLSGAHEKHVTASPSLRLIPLPNKHRRLNTPDSISKYSVSDPLAHSLEKRLLANSPTKLRSTSLPSAIERSNSGSLHRRVAESAETVRIGFTPTIPTPTKATGFWVTKPEMFSPRPCSDDFTASALVRTNSLSPPNTGVDHSMAQEKKLQGLQALIHFSPSNSPRPRCDERDERSATEAGGGTAIANSTPAPSRQSSDTLTCSPMSSRSRILPLPLARTPLRQQQAPDIPAPESTTNNPSSASSTSSATNNTNANLPNAANSAL